MSGKNLDGDGAFEAGVAGAVDLSHPACSQRPKVRALYLDQEA
jgi:hypothetical protein